MSAAHALGPHGLWARQSPFEITREEGSSMFLNFRGQPASGRLARSAGNRRPVKRSASYRPQLLQLEDRLAPAITLAAGFNGLPNTGWNPPDTNLAVGPSHVLETVNE